MNKVTDPKEAAMAAKPAADWQSYVEDFRRAGHEAVDWIAQYLNSVSEMPVLAQTKPGELFDSLPESAPEKGEPFQAILRDFDRLVMPAVTQWNHPRFFAYFACTGKVGKEAWMVPLGHCGHHQPVKVAQDGLERLAFFRSRLRQGIKQLAGLGLRQHRHLGD